jgi:hypothetical protein
MVDTLRNLLAQNQQLDQKQLTSAQQRYQERFHEMKDVKLLSKWLNSEEGVRAAAKKYEYNSSDEEDGVVVEKVQSYDDFKAIKIAEK